jgi:hypothetical protein
MCFFSKLYKARARAPRGVPCASFLPLNSATRRLVPDSEVGGRVGVESKISMESPGDPHSVKNPQSSAIKNTVLKVFM